jgi:hypothetical protein
MYFVSNGCIIGEASLLSSMNVVVSVGGGWRSLQRVIRCHLKRLLSIFWDIRLQAYPPDQLCRTEALRSDPLSRE